MQRDMPSVPIVIAVSIAVQSASLTSRSAIVERKSVKEYNSNEIRRQKRTLDCSSNHSPDNHVDDTEKILVSDPISTLVRVENKFWLCLGEVNGLQIDGCSVDEGARIPGM